ncbi:putative bifunctional diguanylate cyclase/phosphodiesterase [Marinobacter changyiensis]|uniref:putative bifunctional diguanylate cyclase/phosphodiesterase n=1 Tax=Marinobacter changyiensis TaxID=2604091 RepID=UPI001265A6B8|nr:EAL domain-containing protein [Marinobacter changyiensis]
MARLLVALTQPGNRQIIHQALPQHEIIETSGTGLPDEPFDMVVMDPSTFLLLRVDLQTRRSESAPALLPVLLLLQRDQANWVRNLLGTEVHEILLRPSSCLELEARVSNLIKLQTLSMQQRAVLNQSEIARKRTHRAYQVLAAGNELVLRGESEQQLFQSVIESLISLSDYALAWIGVARHDEEHSLEILARAGGIGNYADQLQLSWQGGRSSIGPGGEAVRTRKPVVCQDVATDPAFRPWRRIAETYGIRSAVAIPLIFGEDDVGLLTIYSAQPRAFTDDEVYLLERLAANISFGVCTLRVRSHLREQRALAWSSAYKDSLTGLPNRQWVMEELNKLDAEYARHHRVAAVLFIDLDGFKRINDSLGHEVGDHLLHAVAQRLEEVARIEDFVARLGGDEFLVLMRFDESDDLITGTDDPMSAVAKAAANLAERLTKALNLPFYDGALEHHLGASIGISLYPADTAKASSLVNCADIAMYEAKSTGRGRYRFYYTELSLRHRQKLALKNDLHRAVDTNTFRAYFQPIINICSGQVEYIEALMRLDLPDGTVATPDYFLQTLEETGLISRAGQTMLKEACSSLAQCRQILPDLRLSVNLSANQVWQADLIDQLEDMLRRYDLPASALMLEVTEGYMMTDIRKAEGFLEVLHERGFEIAIDDFGTGYSSLSRLRSMPVSKLKVDKSFMDNVPEDRESLEVVKAILQMAHSLGLDVVAEGIETSSQLQALIEAGCTLIQGFLFARPMPAEELLAYLNPPTASVGQIAKQSM